MFEIDNFAAGLIPNAAWSNFRNVASMDQNDLRVNPQGFLIQRDGHREVFNHGNISQVFAYRTILLAIIDGVLKWGRARGRGQDVTFNDFDPVKTLNTFNNDDPYTFQPVQTADREYILISNGSGTPERNLGGPLVVDLKDVFASTNPQAPTVYDFYLVDPSAPYGINTVKQNESGGGVSSGDYDTPNDVQLFFQAVRTTDDQEGVPWIYDFTDPDAELPSLAPTIAVSEPVPALGIEGQTTFTVNYEAQTLPSSGEMWATGVAGDDVWDYVRLRTSVTPHAILTYGGTYQFTLGAGEITAEVTRPGPERSESFTAYFEVTTNGGANWRSLSRGVFGVGATVTSIRLRYSDYSFDRSLPAGTVIQFRLRTSDGYVRLTQNQSIRLSVESAFKILTALYEDISNDKKSEYGEQPRTEITFRLNLPVPDAADYVDVYRSRRREPPTPYAGGYQLMARLPHQDTYQFTVKFPVADDVLAHPWIDDLPEKGEIVSWRFADVDQHRMYAVTPDESRLYLSYFNGIAERRYMNLVDFVHLPLGGDPITGIKFLDDTYLAIYTAHRILLVYTDPAPELCRVRGQYSQGPNDEAVGCIAPLSLVELDQYHYFLSANKRIYRFGGRRPTWASSKVQPILEPLNIFEADDASIQLSDAVGVAYKGFYYLSFPSMEEPFIHHLVWKGQALEWKGGFLEWKGTDGYYTPNTTVIYDIDRDRWYKDSFGATAFTKDVRDRLYGLIKGDLYALYDDPDATDDIYWEWHSNYLMLPPRTVIYNVCVKTQMAVDMTITVATEEGSQTRDLSAQDENDYWGQYAGFNLRGRTARISIEGLGSTIIDRITINENVR